MEITTAVDRYLAAWNETDPISRRALLTSALADDIAFCDPLLQSSGRDPIDALIGQMQSQLPGGRLQRIGKIDAHHNVVRFTWEAGFEGQDAVIAGTDIAVITEDGRIEAINAFFDRVPAGMLG
ncbi:nuclear transport factor 2 family protein [soil metagenome]